MNSKFLLDKMKRNNNYNSEFNNLKAKDSEYKNSYNNGKNSRHNSIQDLSWRKGSNANNPNNNNNDRKNSYFNTNQKASYNSNAYIHKNKTDGKRERFNSEIVTNFNLNGKYK